MKTYQPVLTTSITAAAALSRHRFIGFDGNVCAAGAKALGVCEADTDQGEQAPVVVVGIAVVEAGGAISAGGAVESDSSGRAVAQSSGTINGYALDAASAAGDLIRVVLK